MLKGGSIEKLMRVYERLTGKQSPPVDAWSFTGMVKDTVTRRFPAPMGNIQFRNGRVITDIYHLNSSIVGLAIAVDKYSPDGMHGSHAISAVKYKNTLFCFNAHGNVALDMDKTIFRQLQQDYKCTNMLIYNGESFQSGDPHGVCTGYAINFIAEMFLAIAEDKIPKKLSQHEYDDFVFRAIHSRGLCFGQKCVVGNSQRNKWNMLAANLAKTQPTPVRNFKLKRSNLGNLSFLPGGFFHKWNTMINITTPPSRPTSPVPVPYYQPTSPVPVPYYRPRPTSPVPVPRPISGGGGNRNKAVAAKTLSSLKDIARRRKIKGFSVYKKAQMENLRRRILNNMNRNSGPVPVPVPVPVSFSSPKPNVGGNRNRNKVVAAKTLSSLKDIARKRKIKGFSVYKKAQMENLRRRILNNMNT
jgi:hypothetical protein